MIFENNIGHYSNHRSVKGLIAQPTNADAIPKVLEEALSRNLKVVPMGSQNCFSSVFLAEGQIHVSLLGLNRLVEFDHNKGEVTIESGMKICEVLKLIIPSGYYLTGLSGSFSDTIGGMISSNCHGKDSWKYGNFGNNVLELKLIKSDGTIIVVRKEDQLMKAVLAGLGLLGIIIEVKLKLKPLPAISVKATERKTNVNTLIEAEDTGIDYKYAWVDIINRKPRSIIRTASFDLSEPHENISNYDFPKVKTSIAGLSPLHFWKLLGLFWYPSTYAVFNKLLLAKTKVGNTKHQSLTGYLYPWLTYPDNKYIFSENSFFELQILFPKEYFITAFNEINSLIHTFRIFPLSSTVKWHQKDDILLSFSGNGLSLTNTFDSILLSTPKGKDFIKEYIELALNLKGRFYLSKYPYLSRGQLKRSHPGFEQWLSFKRDLDPGNIFLSNVSSSWILAS